eukprot:2815904-Amphidinium_carterae.1
MEKCANTIIHHHVWHWQKRCDSLQERRSRVQLNLCCWGDVLAQHLMNIGSGRHWFKRFEQRDKVVAL